MPFIGLPYKKIEKGAVYAETTKMQKSMPFPECFRISSGKCSKIHTESMIHYLEDYMYCTRKLGLYVQLVA